MITKLIYKVSSLLPDWLLRIFPPEKLIKFCVIGGIGGLIGLGILYILTERAELFYLVSLSISWIIVSYIVYMGNCYWTFHSFGGIRGFEKFLVSRVGTTIGGFGLVALLTSVFGIWYMMSSVIGAVIIALINFLIGKNWVWQEAKTQQETKTQEDCKKSKSDL